MQGFIILCFVFSLIRVFIHICRLCRKEREGEREKEVEPKKSKATDVDLSLNKAISEQNKMNPYTAVLPQHSFPLKSRNSRNIRDTRKQELDRIEEREFDGEGDDPNLREIKDRLIVDLHKKRGMM